MAQFLDEPSKAVPKRVSYYELILADLKRCDRETRELISEELENYKAEINISAYTAIYDTIDEYEFEIKTYNCQTVLMKELEEILESNSSQRTVALIYYRGKRIKYNVTLTH
jgi:hypothetical protein